MKRKKGVGTHFKNESDKSSHAREYDFWRANNSFSEVKNWIQSKVSVKIQTSCLEVNQEEVTALAHHKPQNCEVDEHLLHHEQSIRAVGDHLLRCGPPVCAVGDHVLRESEKKQVKEPL